MSADFHVSLLSCMVRDDNVLLKAVIFIFFAIIHYKMVFGDSDGKEPACQCQCRRRKRHGFHPWVGKMPWRRKWQPTAVFLL